MPESLRIVAVFVWGFGCGVLGVCCECAAQSLTYSGMAFMKLADKWWDRALKVSEWD